MKNTFVHKGSKAPHGSSVQKPNLEARFCKKCNTKLSIYNKRDYCFAHQEAEFFVPRLRGKMTDEEKAARKQAAIEKATIVIPTKTCSRCKEVKPLDDFHKHPNTIDKRASQCKACHKIANRESYYERKLRMAQEKERNRRMEEVIQQTREKLNA